jgi:hypothetical protein
MSLDSSYTEKFVQKIKTHFVFSNFLRTSSNLRDNVEKYGAATQDTYGNTPLSTRVIFWINKATNTHPEYITSLLFHGNNGYANASQCYVYVHCFLTPQHHNLHRICLFKISEILLPYEQHAVKKSYFVAFQDITSL